MNLNTVRYFLLIFPVIVSIGHATSIEVYGLKHLTNLPSASGHCIEKGVLYAVGDDAPSIYSLDSDFNITEQKAIGKGSGAVGEDGRIPGNLKADLEACDLFFIKDSPVLVLLGSGTRTDTRERALLYSLKDNSLRWRNVRPFYRYLRKVAGLKDNEFINIEGLASTQETVYLLSRGSHGPNIVFSIAKSDFVDYLTDEIDQIKKITAHSVKLPFIDDVQATLSGATYHSPTQSLIITASVDAHGKGGILGSFLTSVPIADITTKKPIDLIAQSLLIKHKGKPLKSKVEAVSMFGRKEAKVVGVLASDNDDGTSQFMRFKF